MNQLWKALHARIAYYPLAQLSACTSWQGPEHSLRVPRQIRHMEHESRQSKVL
jgi:hypothetical protein